MLGLEVLHGIQVRETCVNSGFDWRSGELVPENAQTFGKFHVRDRNLSCAREAMLTYCRARSLRLDAEIPTKESDQNYNQMLGNPDSEPGELNNSSLELMTPESILSCYISKSKTFMERTRNLLQSVPCAPDQGSAILAAQAPGQEPIFLPLAVDNSNERRAMRAAGLEVIRRNAELFLREQEEGDLSRSDSSDGEYGCDWCENEDASSEEDSE